jgi:PAS domain S-box-containing protein
MGIGAFVSAVLYMLMGGGVPNPRTLWRVIFGILLLLIVVNAIVVWVYSLIIRRITDDVEALAQTAKLVQRGDAIASFSLDRQDELGDLADCIHAMTQRLKEASDRVLEERNYLEAIIVSLPEGVMVVDSAVRLVMMNPTAERLLKVSAKPYIGSNILDQKMPDPLRDAFVRVFETQKPITTEAVMSRYDGKTRTFQIIGTGLSFSQQHHQGWVVILRDVSHERELESLRDGFLRTVTHELRTPLTSIIGFVELLLKSQIGAVSTEQRAALDIVYQESNRLKNLIDDLLELSRMSAGRTSLIYSPTPVYDLLKSIVAAFQPLALGKSLSLGVTPPINGEIVIDADMARLRQIMVNLVSNAIKFTYTGFVTLYLQDLGDWVEIGVQDTGIGLCDEDKEVVFDKFRQVDFTTTRRFEGIGLGLSIVKQLVALHHGTVRVESEYNKGACFIISLPKKKHDALV